MINCQCGKKITRPFQWSDEWDGKPSVGKVIIMLTQNEKLWFVQNAGNKWGCVGGGIEEDETPIEAAMRETLEETGIRLVEDDFVFVRKHVVWNKPIHWYYVELSDSVPTLTDDSVNEISGCGWFCPQCYNSYKVNLFGKQAISLYKKVVAHVY